MTPFESIGRARKVSKMLPFVLYGRTTAEVARIADLLSRWSQPARAELAKAAGVNEPSEATWTALVAAARAREPAFDLIEQWEPEEGRK